MTRRYHLWSQKGLTMTGIRFIHLPGDDLEPVLIVEPFSPHPVDLRPRGGGANRRPDRVDASFVVSNHRTGCCEFIDLAGELDLATAPHLEAVLDRMMVIPHHLVVDVSELTFIDSTGLHLLLRASALVNGRIWVKGASRHILRVIDVTGVSEFFCLDDDPDVAHQVIAEQRTS